MLEAIREVGPGARITVEEPAEEACARRLGLGREDARREEATSRADPAAVAIAALLEGVPWAGGDPLAPGACCSCTLGDAAVAVK